MARRRRREDERLSLMRKAFWDSDSAPDPMPDTQEAWTAYETQQLRYKILTAVEERLLKLDLTQQQLAGKMGISEGRISQILSGEQNLTIRTLAALAAALEAEFSISLVDRNPVGSPTRRLV
jgi:transcriptional regulator with XRE-family HTH domain